MTNPTQHRSWILGIRGRATGAALALAVVLVSAAITAQVAQAQTLTTLHSFDGTDGGNPTRGWSRPAMGTSTGQRKWAGSTTSVKVLVMARFSNYPEWHADRAAQLQLFRRLPPLRGAVAVEKLLFVPNRQIGG